ncbi:hypothetical protein OAA60_00670 [Porticoccaceae bacterium]|nr:hypothetical protein [Porticoccaceae bacterium]
MVMQDDIATLWAERGSAAVSVVQHDYKPKPGKKFLGNKQTIYPRKNWSSVMLFNNPLCRALTKKYVETASGMQLHRFMWTDNVGSLPPEWNFLVGEENQCEFKPSLIHYTLGGPYFEEFKDCEYSKEWYLAYHSMKHVKEGHL